MKIRTQIAMFAALLFIAFSMARLMGQSQLTMSPGGLLSACKLSAAKELTQCNVSNDPANPDGLYLSANGAGWFQVSKAGSGGVASFAGRTGSVLPAANDYSYSQLSGKPTTISCTTSSQSNTGFTASGCVIQ